MNMKSKLKRTWDMILDKSDISFWYRLEVICHIWKPTRTIY